MRRLLLIDWGVPMVIISVRDGKSTSKLWHGMWVRPGNKAAAQADGFPASGIQKGTHAASRNIYQPSIQNSPLLMPCGGYLEARPIPRFNLARPFNLSMWTINLPPDSHDMKAGIPENAGVYDLLKERTSRTSSTTPDRAAH